MIEPVIPAPADCLTSSDQSIGQTPILVSVVRPCAAEGWHSLSCTMKR
jgi:hypothetical protein